MKTTKTITVTLFSALGLLSVPTTQAATVSKSFSGNDCSGYFGQGFDSCTIFVDSEGTDIELSPVIAKFGGDLTLSETNDELFASVDGSEFGFSELGDENSTGTWTYTPGTNDPGVRYWATKAANGFILSWEVDETAISTGGVCDVSDVFTLNCLDAAQVQTSNTWSTPDGKELSHITFYDTAVVPVPAAVWLLGSALGGLGFMRRRKSC